MSWWIFLVYLTKIFCLDNRTKVLKFIQILISSAMSRCWLEWQIFSIFLIMVYQVSVHWDITELQNTFKMSVLNCINSLNFVCMAEKFVWRQWIFIVRSPADFFCNWYFLRQRLEYLKSAHARLVLIFSLNDLQIKVYPKRSLFFFS